MALAPFEAAVAKPGGFDGESASSTLAAWAMRDGARLLIDVSIGFASSVFAFDASGRALEMPAEYRWSFRFHGPLRRIGGLVAFDACSIQDAGVRYDFRLGFLRRTAAGYARAGSVSGASTYDFDDEEMPRLTIYGNRAIVRSLDAPGSFDASGAVSILRRSETWDASGPAVRRIAVRLGDRDVRAADAWLTSHRGTRLAQGFVVTRANGMANDVQRGQGWVIIDLEGAILRFDLIDRDRRVTVRRVAVVPFSTNRVRSRPRLGAPHPR